MCSPNRPAKKNKARTYASQTSLQLHSNWSLPQKNKTKQRISSKNVHHRSKIKWTRCSIVNMAHKAASPPSCLVVQWKKKKKNHQKCPLFRGFLIHKQRKNKEKEAIMMVGWVSSEEDVVCSALLQQGPLLRLWMTGPGTPKQPLTLQTSRLRKSERSLDGLVRSQGDVASSVQQQSKDPSVTCLFVGISCCSVALKRHQYNVNVVCLTAATVYAGVGVTERRWIKWSHQRGGDICPSGSECCIAVSMCASFHGDVVEEVVHRESFLVRFSDWFLNKDRKEKTVWYLQRSGLTDTLKAVLAVPVRGGSLYGKRGDGVDGLAVRVSSQPPSLRLQVGQVHRVGRVPHTLPVLA